MSRLPRFSPTCAVQRSPAERRVVGASDPIGRARLGQLVCFAALFSPNGVARGPLLANRFERPANPGYYLILPGPPNKQVHEAPCRSEPGEDATLQ
jgi:hypothetical protein